MTFNLTSVPKKVADLFPRTEEFGYELMKLSLRVVCDTMQERDSIYKRAKDVHLYVATLGPRTTKNQNWYGVYWSSESFTDHNYRRSISMIPEVSDSLMQLRNLG